MPLNITPVYHRFLTRTTLNRALRLSQTHTQTANRNWDGTSGAKEEPTHVFFGLQILDAVEEDVEAARQDALVIRGSRHGVCLAGRRNAIGEQQPCKHTATRLCILITSLSQTGMFP